VVKVSTRSEAGQLGAKLALALASYAGEPVDVRLDDGDTQPIARLRLAALPPLGSTGTKWQFKAKTTGLMKVRLSRLPDPGTFRLKLKARWWFSTAAANQPAASTRLTVTIGSQCFGHAVTKKVD
jgi:hypothetical protein